MLMPKAAAPVAIDPKNLRRSVCPDLSVVDIKSSFSLKIYEGGSGRVDKLRKKNSLQI